MNRLVVLLLSLVLALPAQALDLQGLYEQALTASRQGDFVEALPPVGQLPGAGPSGCGCFEQPRQCEACPW